MRGGLALHLRASGRFWLLYCLLPSLPVHSKEDCMLACEVALLAAQDGRARTGLETQRRHCPSNMRCVDIRAARSVLQCRCQWSAGGLTLLCAGLLGECRLRGEACPSNITAGVYAARCGIARRVSPQFRLSAIARPASIARAAPSASASISLRIRLNFYPVN
jgi:hypothetical protein